MKLSESSQKAMSYSFSQYEYSTGRSLTISEYVFSCPSNMAFDIQRQRLKQMKLYILPTASKYSGPIVLELTIYHSG